MATLQKFKILATQCAVAGSPTRSPTSSSVLHLRRWKTLRMLLSSHSHRRSFRRQDLYDRQRIIANEPEKNKKDMAGHTLKDLFVSSPLFEDDCKLSKMIRSKVEVLVFPSLTSSGGGGPAGRRGGPGSPGPVWVRFSRYKLLRRAWRPELDTIPE